MCSAQGVGGGADQYSAASSGAYATKKAVSPSYLFPLST